MHIRPGTTSLLCTAASLLSLGSAVAQQAPALAQPTVRISQIVSNRALVTLKGNTDPRARAQFDQGAADASAATGRLALLLRPSEAQQSALREYLGELQDPHSANYHKWLTPAAYGANFGISDQDLETVENWLRSEGFTIASVPPSRNFILFSGTFGQVAQAFHTSMHAYSVNGVRHYANATDPSIPAAIAPVVLGVSPLNDFRPKPAFVQQLHGEARMAAGRVQMTKQAAQNANPAYTTSSNNGSPFLLVTPADAATIYDSPNPLNTRFTGGTQYTGSGVKIGLVGDSDLPVQDYLNYRRLLLNEGANPVQPTLVVDGVDPGQLNGGSAEEALIDAEFSAGLAPQASIYFYSSADDVLQSGPINAALRAVEDNNVFILSMSFGECESDLGTSGNQQVSALWQQAAAQGITVLVSSGDAGSASCDSAGNGPAQNGLSVNGLGSTPYNISVGGTDFDVLSGNFAQYVSAATGGSSSYGSALGYIPENPWNESISNNPPGSYAGNTAQEYHSANGGPNFTILFAGGGGASSAALCLTQDLSGNCLSTQGYPTPAFQTGINVGGQNPNAPPAGVRYLPDVSLFASTGSEYPATWLVCADSTVTGAQNSYVDCQPDGTGGFNFDGVGGTSTSAPAFAGIFAMVSQSLGGQRLGIANNVLYNLEATNSNSGSIFHDITAGNISVPCKAGTTNCATNSASQDFLTGYNAGTGYDLATGLGSVDISNLVSAWKQVQFTPTSVSLTAGTSTGSLSDAPVSITHGTVVTLAATVSPATAMGDVSVTGPTGAAGLAVSQVIPLSNGTGSINVNDLPGGTYSVHAYYQGDVKDSPSTSSTPIEFTVAPEPSSPFLYTFVYDLGTGNQSQNPATLNYGEYAFAYIQPANANAQNTSGSGTVGSHGFATGTATLLNNGTAFTTPFSGAEALNSQGQASYPLYNLAPGAYALGANYSGDASYNASATTANLPLTINKGPTTLTVHVGNATATNPGAIQVELDTDSVGANPTGAVTLTVNGQTYNSATTANELQSDGAVAELVTFAVPASALSGGGLSLGASYAGDGNYAGSGAAACTFVPPATAALAPTALPHGGQPLVAAAACGVCGLLFLLVPARRRAWRSLLVLCFAAGLIGITGCGASSNSSGSNPITLHSTCSK